MQFSQLLKLNVIPKWSNHYASYSSLKRLVSKLEIEPDTNDELDTALNEQLERIATFYTKQEKKVFDQIDQFQLDLKTTIKDSDAVSTDDLNSLESKVDDPLFDLKHRLFSIYVALLELESYTLLNHRIFEELSLDTHESVMNCTIFTSQTSLLHQIQHLEILYAEHFCRGFPVDQIKRHLQQQIATSGDTHQKTHITKSKSITSISSIMKIEGKDYTDDDDDEDMVITERDERYYKIHLPWKDYKIASKHLFNSLYFFASCFIFIGLLFANLFDNPQENACFALLLFSAILWATEAIPLYATSFIIPFFIVLLNIMRDPQSGEPMGAKAAAKTVFSAMFSGTILMLLGGFALAGALSKYGIARAFATHVLSKAGTRPHWILLCIMLIAGCLSMLISNVATPVLCFSLIEPILNGEVGPCLILGIALASNIGGMTSPISSPQNIITIQYLEPNPGWGRWMAVSLPLSILSIFVCWGILLFVYKPNRKMHHLQRIKQEEETWTWRHGFIIAVTVITIGLWCAESSLESRIGDTGIIATLPLFFFFSTGILKKEDLHHRFLWSVVMLAQGGMALGNAVSSCGLLQDIALRIKDNISSLSPFQILCIFSMFILVFSTFVSHTVAALIIVPIVKEVGEKLPIPHPNLFVMGAGLACSAGMGLPVSGFPNMSAVMLERPDKRPYLTTRDFFITGIPTSIICTLLIFTLGYAMMTLIGY